MSNSICFNDDECSFAVKIQLVCIGGWLRGKSAGLATQKSQV